MNGLKIYFKAYFRILKTLTTRVESNTLCRYIVLKSEVYREKLHTFVLIRSLQMKDFKVDESRFRRCALGCVIYCKNHF